MKKITILMSMMLMASVVFGQALMQKRTQHFTKVMGDVEQTRNYTVIWEDDFSDPGLWVADYDESNPNDGPWVIGVDGPTGGYSGGMGPIASTTADNGFALYDSDAHATAASAQDSKLIYDGTIDLSANDKVAVTFESYYRAFNGMCYIELSTDGTTWEQFQVHEDIDVNSSTDNPELVMINVSSVVANEAAVHFRFRYVGEWDYAWMVDDVKFVVAPDHDLKLMSTRVNFWPQYIDYGYSGFYSMVPQSQITSENAFMFFSGVVKNMGTIDATPTLSISVTDPTENEIFSNSIVYDSIMSTGAMDTLAMDAEENFLFFPNPELGLYTWTFETYEDGVTEESPADNSKVYQTEITEYMYAHDNGQVTGGWSTDNYTIGGNDQDVVGVEYEFFNQDTIAKAYVYISSLTEVGAMYVFKLMSWDGEKWVEEIAVDPILIESEEDVAKMHEIVLPDPYIVEPVDGIIRLLAAVESYSGTNAFRLGVDATAPTNGYETWMYFSSEDSWYYYGGDHVPIIRVEFASPASVGQDSFTDFDIYPNPTNGMVRIQNVKDATIEVFNMLGERIAIVNSADFNTNINLSNYAEGTYIVRVTSEQGVGTRKINLVK